ncbi:unnamed protein product [Sphagnum tenellum]
MWHTPTILMVSFSCTLLIAFIKGGLFTYIAILATFAIGITTVTSQLPFIYGPFTSSERQAQVWLALAYLMSILHITDADGMDGGEVPLRTIHVLAVFVGAASSFIVLAVFNITCQRIAENKAIALTFEAGPHPQVTHKLLEVLKSYNAKATFFVRGHAATRWPGTVSQIDREGHQVESQSMAARDFNMFPGPVVRGEMNLASDVILKLINRKPRWIRNVFGFRDYRLHLHAARSGMRVAYWSVCPWDWEQIGVEKVVEEVIRQLDPNGGDILNFTETDGHFTTPNYSLPATIDKVS